jgi:DNA transformation protein
MSISPAFKEFLADQMAGFGAVTIKNMFGGAGIYHAGLMFALAVDDVLFLKADQKTKPDFESEGLTPFTYETKGGGRTVMSYWRAPERCMDDGDEMAAWCQKAYQVALRAQKPAGKTKKSKASA